MGSTRPVFSQKAANTTIPEAVPVFFCERFFFGEDRVSLGPFFVNMSCSWFLCVMALNEKSVSVVGHVHSRRILARDDRNSATF